MARRFEINPSLLKDINKLGSDAEKLEALDAVLNKLGFTQEVLTNQAKTTAASYDRLGTAIENIKVKAGGDLAKLFEPIAKASTDALTTAAQLETQGAGLIGQAQTFAQYSELVAQAQQKQNVETSNTAAILNAVSPAFGSLISSYIMSQSTIQALTPAQFEYANALVKTGMSAELAATQARQLITQSSTFQEFATGLNATLTEQATKYDELTLAQLRYQFSGEQLATTFGTIQAAGPQYAQALNEINVLLEQGKLEPLEYANALQTIVNAANNAKVAEDALKDSMVELSAAAQELIVQEINEAKSKLGNAAATKELHGFQTDLANIADAVAKGLFTDAEAAEFLRLKYGEAAKEAEYLIAQQARIMEGEARIRGQRNAKGARDDSGNVGFNAPGRRGSGDVDAAIRGIEEAKKATEEATQAQKDLELARARAAGNKAREIELLKAEQRQYAQGSAEYIKAQQAIEAAQREGGSKRTGAAQKTADKLEEISIKEGEKLTDAEIKKQQKLLDIQQDFAEKFAAQIRENEVSKRSSRADFYEGLLDAPEGVDTSAMSAAYEQAFAEAQKIAQEGRAKLADEYLKLRTEQIKQLAELDQKKKEIEDSDLSDKEKEAKLKQLEEVRKLREEAQKEELKNLVEGGDALENELNERLTAEEERYDQNVDKIQTAADRAAEARIRAWQRANGVISGTVPAELANLTPNIPQAPAPNTQPQEPTQTNPVPITSPTPIQVTADKAMPVFDVAVFNQLNAVSARLEAGLTNIVNAINNNTSVLASKLDAVDGSVRRIQSKNVLAG